MVREGLTSNARHRTKGYRLWKELIEGGGVSRVLIFLGKANTNMFEKKRGVRRAEKKVEKLHIPFFLSFFWLSLSGVCLLRALLKLNW